MTITLGSLESTFPRTDRPRARLPIKVETTIVRNISPRAYPLLHIFLFILPLTISRFPLPQLAHAQFYQISPMSQSFSQSSTHLPPFYQFPTFIPIFIFIFINFHIFYYTFSFFHYNCKIHGCGRKNVKNQLLFSHFSFT